jgi:hypothetical protein
LHKSLTKGKCFVPRPRPDGESCSRTLVETSKDKLTEPARRVQTILADQIKTRTIDVPLPWPRMICLAMTKQVKRSDLISLFGCLYVWLRFNESNSICMYTCFSFHQGVRWWF